LVFAKDAAVQAALTELWGAGRVRRCYYAICQGQLEKPAEIDLPLDGHPALTKVAPLQVHPHCTELAVEILTGRTHQIRRHLAALGHPLMGERRYAAGGGNQRLALHHTEVSLPHPKKNGEQLQICSPIPRDEFRSYLCR
jgi:23S rRNA-/tRNA-specific pseudouridylate synthase